MRRVSASNYFFLAAALLLSLSFCFYFKTVRAGAFEQAFKRSNDFSRGNFSDLYPRWLGSRELILRGRNPYSPEITREIQEGFYGRLLDARRPGEPVDEERFAYPVYVVFLLAPTIHFDFAVVQHWGEWAFLLMAFASALFWMYALAANMGWVTQASLAILALGSFPVIEAMHLQQLTLLVCFLLAVFAVAMNRGRLVFAGIVLALATIKPQLVFLLIVWLSFWVFADWRKRRALALSFGATLLCLVLASEMLLPGWITPFFQGLVAYHRYADSYGILQMFFTKKGGAFASIIILVIAAVFCWRSRKCPAMSSGFNTTTAAVLAASVLLLPNRILYNQVLLFPSLIMLFLHRRELLGSGRLGRFLLLFTTTLAAWPYVAALLLNVLRPILPVPNAADPVWETPIYLLQSLPVKVLLWTGIYTYRLALFAPVITFATLAWLGFKCTCISADAAEAARNRWWWAKQKTAVEGAD